MAYPVTPISWTASSFTPTCPAPYWLPPEQIKHYLTHCPAHPSDLAAAQVDLSQFLSQYEKETLDAFLNKFIDPSVPLQYRQILCNALGRVFAQETETIEFVLQYLPFFNIRVDLRCDIVTNSLAQFKLNVLCL